MEVEGEVEASVSMLLSRPRPSAATLSPRSSKLLTGSFGGALVFVRPWLDPAHAQLE